MPTWISNSIFEVSLQKQHPFRRFWCTRGKSLKRKSNHDLYSMPRHTFPWRSCISQGKLWKPSWCFRKLSSYLLSFKLLILQTFFSLNLFTTHGAGNYLPISILLFTFTALAIMTATTARIITVVVIIIFILRSLHLRLQFNIILLQSHLFRVQR